jgi:hypothetical protein
MINTIKHGVVLSILSIGCLMQSACDLDSLVDSRESDNSAATGNVTSYRASLPEYTPKILNGVRLIEGESGSLSINDNRVDYTIIYQTYDGEVPAPSLIRSHRPEYIASTFESASYGVISFLNIKGISTEDCRDNSFNINIFIVNKSIMRDRDRFARGLRLSPQQVPYEVWGFYDSTSFILNNSAIITGQIAMQYKDSTLHHEAAHYWWDRLCVKNSWSGTTENFATEYQRFYDAGGR